MPRLSPDIVVPAEEAPHELTFMQWPVSRKVHPDQTFLAYLQRTIAAIGNTIAEFEPVVMLAEKSAHAQIRTVLSDAIKLWDIPTEDLWCRDSGPLFAKTRDNKLVVSHIQFNGWGKKQIHRRDGLVAKGVAQRLGHRHGK